MSGRQDITNKKIILSFAAKTILCRLRQNEYEGYIVGGTVRDSLLGIIPHDYDVATSASPQTVLKIFDDFTILKTGIKHGTVTVLINGEPIEVTTFRHDGNYIDGRHPESVSFTKTLLEDLKRRDFTVNAIAYSEESGIIDPFGGKNDLKKRILRTVGDPEERFSEDALRILRAIRFASVYGFKIEENTKKSIFELSGKLNALSAERIFSELKQIITGKNAEEVLLEYPYVISRILPELQDCIGFDQHTPYHKYDVYTHSVKALSACPADTITRLAALLHDCGKPQTFEIKNGVGHFYSHSAVSTEKAQQALVRLKADNVTKNAVVKLVKYHDAKIIDETEKSVKRWMNKLSSELFLKLIDLMIADNTAKTEESKKRLQKYKNIKEIIKSVIEKDECFSLRQLKINGNDLISLGIPKGKRVGKALSFLLDKVIEDECENEKNALLECALKNKL